MKKLLALLILLSFPALASNTPPPGVSGQLAGNASGKWAGISVGTGLLNSGGVLTATGTVTSTPAGSNPQIQYNNNGSAGGLATDTLAAYNAHNVASNGLSFDPRDVALGANPAICAGYNTFTTNGTTTTFTYTIPFTGSSSTDNTNFMVFYEPTNGTGTATILTTSQYSVTGVNSGTGGTITLNSAPPSGNVLIVVHDDANGLINAATASVATGGHVDLPDGCTIYGSQSTGTQLADLVQVIGNGFTPNYGYQAQGIKPYLRIIAPTGFAPSFGINVSGKNQQFYEGFTITSNVPGYNSLGFLQVPVLIGANGSSGAGGGQSPGIVVQYVTFNEGSVGFGAPIGGNSAYIFAVLRFNNFTANNAGVYGPLSDAQGIGNNFNSNGGYGTYGSAGGLVIGPQEGAPGASSAGRWEYNRFEYNSEGVVIQSGSLTNFDGNQFDGNTACGMDLNTYWSQIIVTGGWFRGNANGGSGGSGNTTAGQDADICFNAGASSGSGGFHTSNVVFQTNYSEGYTNPLGSANATSPPYVLDVSTLPADNADITINGSAPNVAGNLGSYVTDFAIYRNGRPAVMSVNVDGQATQGKLINGQYASQATGLPPNQWATVNAYGDQASYYSYYVPLAQVWPTLVNNGLNGSLNLYNDPFSYDCGVVNDEIMVNSTPNNTGNPVSTWLSSVNDPTFGGGPGATFNGHRAITHQCRIAGLTWMSIPSAYKVYGQNSNCVKTGTWANDTAYGGTYGVTSDTNGSTLTCSITSNGGPVYFWYKMHDNDGGTFTYAIDGGSTTTIPTNGNNYFSYPVDGTHYSVGGIRLPVETIGSHSVVFTVTSSTSSSNNVNIIGVGTPPGKSYLGGGPSVFLGGQLFELAGNDTYAAEATLLNTDQQSDVLQLNADGLPVNFVNLRGSGNQAAYINNSSDMTGGANYLVPNATGQQHITDAFLGAMQPQKNPVVSGVLDPRNYGAVCNTTLALGTLTTTANSNLVSVSGYNVSTADIGKTFAGNAGSLSWGTTAGIVTGVNTGTNQFQLSVTPTVATSNGNATFGHDDTSAFNAASAASAASGTPVFVPNNCGIRNFTPSSASTISGQSYSLGYNYGVYTTPNLYVLETGFLDDTYTYGINLGSGKYGIALNGFEIIMPTFPVLTYTNIGATCVGTATGTAGYNQGVSISNMTFQFCPVAFGLNYGATTSGHIFVQSQHNQFANNGWGWYGAFSDWVSIDDVWTGNFTGGADLGQFGSGYSSGPGRMIGSRFEENNAPLLCDGCLNTHLEGTEFQFNHAPGLILNGAWQNFTMAGGWFEDNAQNYYCNNFTASISGTTMTVTGNCASGGGIYPGQVITGTGVSADTYVVGTTFNQGGVGTYTISPSQTVTSETMSSSASTEILVNGAGANNTYASFTNLQWGTTGQTAAYDILGVSAANYNIQFTGGNQSDTGNAKTYGTAFSRWLPSSTPPKTFGIDGLGLPILRTGRSDFSENAAGGIGIGTSSANTGVALDLGNNTNSLLLPVGTTGQEPTGITGMIRYNTTKGGVENYNGTSWSVIGSVINSPVKVPLRVVTASGSVSVSASTDYLVILNKTIGAATTVNLPASPIAGYVFIIKDGKGDAATNNITVTTTDSTTIDGAASVVMATNYQSSGFVFNGVQWNQQ